jgi:hypothetical protein
MGVAEEAEKTVTGTVDALKFQPVLLVIVLLNCMMIAGGSWYLSVQETQRSKLTELLIAKCVPQGGVH